MASSVVMSPDSFSIVYESIEDKVKTSIEKLERHIDQLEEDIEFFNKNRIQQKEEIDKLQTKLDAAETKLAGQEADIIFLKTREIFFTDYTNYLEGRIAALEDKKKDEILY